MVKLLVAKILCMVGVFFFMLLGALVPVKVIQMDFEKAQRSKKVLSLCNTFGGGVFLATCFNALLPAVREKLRQVLSLGHISTDYPLAETLMLLGFFLTVFVEQLVLTFRRERPSFIDLETFNAGSDAGSGVPGSVASALLQGLAGGTFLFVTFLEILAKELEDKSDRLLKVLFLVLGYAVLAGMVFLKW
ncbi:PREDICTED: zinc transporter ZIP3 [Dipodomys ordii]|uniref:Zinc transporter ZIP3 n=1 Tax=Dipodomys ordii TaxID=10020 RepID=A0A1S3FNE4_DIPOR|nr:PREDICTED: zinc transporter ZIP3 [Dipodomys ordii]